MKSAFQDRIANSISRQIPAIFFALLVGCLLTGCGQRYVVDKKKQQVFWREDRGLGAPEERMLITNADAATFKVLHLSGPPNFARDKNHVYLFGRLVAGAQPESFRRFAIPGEPHHPNGANFYYYRDSQHVFLYAFSLGGFITMLPDSDPASFKAITNGLLLNRTGWSRDRTRVYLFDWGFVPKDVDTIEPLTSGWARDSKAYYWNTHEVEGADRNTFQIIGNGTGCDNRFDYQIEEVWNTNHTEIQKINFHKQPLK
jgi:DKNYY family